MNIEIRASKDDSAWELEGYATTYGSPYPVRDGNGAYAETITRGCFAGAVSGRDSVELRVEHNRMAPPLASTAARSGTMTLADDATGLLLRATLPKDDPDNQAAVSKAARGLLDRMSVGFSDAVSAWSKDRSRRAIRSARLVEVSLCGAPSNPGAVVTSVRAEGTAEGFEVRYSPSGLAVVERAAKYSATEIEALGQAGKAFKAANGIYDYPAADRADVLAGIHRVGSAEPADKAPLRRFLTGRAKALGASRLIPLTWREDGSVAAARSVITPRALRAELGLPPDGTPGRVRSWQKILVSRTATPEERTLAKNAIDMHYRTIVRGMRVAPPAKRAERPKRKPRLRTSIWAEREFRRVWSAR